MANGKRRMGPEERAMRDAAKTLHRLTGIPTAVIVRQMMEIAARKAPKPARVE